MIKLTTDFIDYLKEDGVYIPVKSIYERYEFFDDEELREVSNGDKISHYELPKYIEEQIASVLRSSERGVFINP